MEPMTCNGKQEVTAPINCGGKVVAAPIIVGKSQVASGKFGKSIFLNFECFFLNVE